MAGARDYEIDPQTQGLGPPNMAAQLFGMISSLPDAYQQGVKNKFERGQMARTEELQKPFLDESGQPITDPRRLAEMVVQRQPEKALEAAPFLFKTSPIDVPAGPSPYGGSAVKTSPDAQSPEPLQRAAAAQGQQPPGDVAPDIDSQGRNRGPLNVRQIAENMGVDANTPGFAEQFRGPGLDRPLHPSIVQGVQAKIAMLQQAGMFGPAEGAQQQPTASFNQRFAGQPGAMAGPAPGPAVSMGTAGPGGPAPASALAMVPSGADPRAYAQGLQQAGDRQLEIAKAKAFRGIPSKAEEDQASQYHATAQAVLKELADATRPTTGMREARDQSVQEAARTREIDKLRAVEADNRKAQIFKSGSAAEDMQPQLELSRRVVNSPNFNSGVGHQFFDGLQSLNQQLFGGTALKSPGEIYDKLRAAGALNEIRELGASGIGAVRVPEMRLVDKMVADRSIQAPGIRAVTEVEIRLQKRVHDIYQLGQEYLQKHPQLDDGFVREVSAWKAKPENSIFSKEELAHPELLSRPVFASPQEMAASRMPRGTPFRTPDGGHGVIP